MSSNYMSFSGLSRDLLDSLMFQKQPMTGGHVYMLCWNVIDVAEYTETSGNLGQLVLEQKGIWNHFNLYFFILIFLLLLGLCNPVEII